MAKTHLYTIGVLLALGWAALAAPRASRAGEAPARLAAAAEPAADAVLVAFKQQAPLAARWATVDRFALDVDAKAQNPHVARLRLRGAGRRGWAAVQSTVERLRQDPNVRVVQPDYRRRISLIPNDPQFATQWGLRNVGQSGGAVGADIGAATAWDRTTGSDTVIVAVIDTGVDYNHPDLRDNILRNSSGHVVGHDFINNDADPMDDNGHGTHCAGIIGARGNNSLGVTGVCQRVKIVPLKFLDFDGGGFDSDAIQSIDYAISAGARVISASWGSDETSPLLLEAIQRARDAGVLFVAAAGNGGIDGLGDSQSEYPGAYNASSSNVLSVAASTRTDSLASFSNYGSTVDIAAPGQSILSTVPGAGYSSLSGTSMATPCVAGAAALSLAANPAQSVSQLKNLLLSSTDLPASLSGRVRFGRLNAAAMLALIPGTYSISGTVTLDGSGLSGVTVSTGGATTTTDANGAYTLSNLPPGAYTVTPTRTGYTFDPANRAVTLSTADVSAVNFTGTQDPGTFSISGAVTLNGTGLSAVTVSAGGVSATTNASGAYTLSGLAPGSYTVTPSRTGYTFSPASRTVNLPPDTTGIDFIASAVPSTFSISGAVTLNGAGLSGVTVSAGGRTASTSSTGAYSITGLTAGAYTVTPALSGHTFTPGSRSVTLSAADVTGVDFTAAPETFSISGTITAGGRGLSDVTVTAGSRSATTSAAGAYTISGLLAGTHTVTPSRTGYVFTPASRSVTINTADRTAVSFTAAASVVTFSISGTVTYNGAGLAGVTVRAGTASATTSAAGAYTITGLRAGSYTVTPSRTGYLFTPASRSVTLGTANLTGISFTARGGSSISGSIAFNGAPLSGVTVRAGGAATATNAAGAYTLTGLAAGTYTVVPSRTGFTFTPASRSVSVTAASRTGINFVARR